MIFTDEKTFCSSQDGRLNLWRHDRTRYAEEHVVPWPSKSPDCPIENILGIMVQMWVNGQERTKQPLEEHCHEVWESLRGSHVCSRIVDSIPDRLRAVSDSMGAYTRY